MVVTEQNHASFSMHCSFKEERVKKSKKIEVQRKLSSTTVPQDTTERLQKSSDIHRLNLISLSAINVFALG